MSALLSLWKAGKACLCGCPVAVSSPSMVCLGWGYRNSLSLSWHSVPPWLTLFFILFYSVLVYSILFCILSFYILFYFNLTLVPKCTSTRTFSRALPDITPWRGMGFTSLVVALTEKTEMVVIDSWPTSCCLSQAGAGCGRTHLVPSEADRDWLHCPCHQGLVTCRSAAIDTTFYCLRCSVPGFNFLSGN